MQSNSSTAAKSDVFEGRKLGVEPIHRASPVAPSANYAVKNRAPQSRAPAEADMSGKFFDLWMRNRSGYGVRALWKIARMVGINIGRDYKGRLVRAMRIEGAKRSKRVHVT